MGSFFSGENHLNFSSTGVIFWCDSWEAKEMAVFLWKCFLYWRWQEPLPFINITPSNEDLPSL